jgi:hypothetical protein
MCRFLNTQGVPDFEKRKSDVMLHSAKCSQYQLCSKTWVRISILYTVYLLLFLFQRGPSEGQKSRNQKQAERQRQPAGQQGRRKKEKYIQSSQKVRREKIQLRPLSRPWQKLAMNMIFSQIYVICHLMFKKQQKIKLGSLINYVIYNIFISTVKKGRGKENKSEELWKTRHSR